MAEKLDYSLGEFIEIYVSLSINWLASNIYEELLFDYKSFYISGIGEFPTKSNPNNPAAIPK